MASPEEISVLVEKLRSAVGLPANGLQEDLFLFVSGLTPMVNVDLLVKDGHGRTLLTWRDDAFFSPGWHVPGGIIRFKETMSDRLHAVAKIELGASISFKPEPLVVQEMFNPHRQARGHFISFLFECRLLDDLDPKLEFDEESPAAGQWAWHESYPENMIDVHKVYRRFI